VEIVDGQADLLTVVGALDAAGRLPDLLDRRQQQGDQDADDGNDNQQFDKRKTTSQSQQLSNHDSFPPSR
jgi:hypothetical protein